MQIQIKKAVKSGNSSAVILPKSWLNKDVRIELIRKTPEIILSEVINIAGRHIELEDIIGIYLTGSYARAEESKDSDIDILIITKNIDREMIVEGIYNILIVSKELLKQKLEKDLFPIGQMINEAKPLLNSDYIDSIKIEVTKANIGWYLSTTEDKLKLIGKIINRLNKNNKRYANDRLAYTLILRIRTLHIIKKLMAKKAYSKTDFIKLITRVSGGKEAYERYLAVKNDLKYKQGISVEEVKRLYEYLKNQLEGIRKDLN